MSSTDSLRRAMIVVGILFSVSAVAGTFTSGHGYSIDYPEGWTVADAAMSAELESEADKTLAGHAPSEGFGVDAVILGPAGEVFTPNINVVVSPGTTAVSQANVGAARQDFVALHKEQGGQLQSIDATVETIGGRHAYSLRYEATMPGREAPLWQWVLIAPGTDTTCHFTFSCLAADKERLIPVFQQMIGSVRFEEAGSEGTGWPLGVVIAVVVAVALIGGIMALRKRRGRNHERQ